MKTHPCDREAVALLACSALEAAEAGRTRRHLEQCPACRDYFREMSELCAVQAAAARRLPEAEVSERLHRRVAVAIRVRSRTGWDPLRELGKARWLPAAGAAAVLLVFGFSAAHFIPSPSPTASQPLLPPPPGENRESGSSNLLSYRLALNRSPEELDRLLAHEAALPTLSGTISLRPASAWVDAGL